ncbi:MAG: hypothetical protein MZW92_42350 [Comamonadaceae bacterium]|nr:hypothetical protein [Comamonadaceae bacterium]
MRPYPGVRRHQHDEQRRQVVVQLRPVRPAEAVHEGLHVRRVLHLVALGAGDRVPLRGRRRPDQDDLRPGRAAPAVGERHLRAAVRPGQAVSVADASGVTRGDSSAAGSSRASTPTRPASRSRSGPTASTTATDPVNGSDIALDEASTTKWINTDVFTSILNGTSTNATPVDHLRTLLAAVPRRPQGLDQQLRPVVAEERRAPQGRCELAGEVRVHQRLQRTLLPGPGHRHDQRDVRAGHGVEPGQLRTPRAGRRQVHLLGVRRCRRRVPAAPAALPPCRCRYPLSRYTAIGIDGAARTAAGAMARIGATSVVNACFSVGERHDRVVALLVPRAAPPGRRGTPARTRAAPPWRSPSATRSDR